MTASNAVTATALAARSATLASLESRGVGVMLVGHGTRDEVGTREFFELSQQLQAKLGDIPVAPCLLEFQRPTIAEAWNALLDRGMQRVCVAPLLLFAAGHAKQDIPEAVAACHASSPEIGRSQSGPLSRHPALIELSRRRLRETLDRQDKLADAAPGRTAIVMVGRGSYDPCAQADMKVFGEIVGDCFDVAALQTAFYAMAEPRLPDVLEELAASGAYDRLVVQPHLLFAGRLDQAVRRQVQEADARHSGVRFAVSDYLGPDPLVAEAIVERVASAEVL